MYRGAVVGLATVLACATAAQQSTGEARHGDRVRCARLAFGMYQLVFLAPFLWILGTREQLMARMMADQFAYYREPSCPTST